MMPEFIANLGLVWILLIVLFSIVNIILVSMALYISANRGQKGWFTVLIIFGSVFLSWIYLIINPGRKKRK